MKILIVGNCQARPVAEILTIAGANVEIIGKVIVHLASNDDAEEHKKLYDEADVILAQQVASNFPVTHVSTDYIKANYSKKVVTWVNVFFHGQNPDIFYVTSESGSRIIGPMDVYHSKALIDQWKLGVSAEEIDRKVYITQTTDFDVVRDRVEKSFSDLQKREVGVDISMYDYIEDNWQERPLFHTFNHPNLSTVIELCDRVCKHLGLPLVERESNKLIDRLTLIVPPMEDLMAKKLGIRYLASTEINGLEVAEGNRSILPGKRKVYGFDEFVSVAFKCYDAQKSNLDNVRFTPA